MTDFGELCYSIWAEIQGFFSQLTTYLNTLLGTLEPTDSTESSDGTEIID
ncbi:MAG: hypothetical protein R3Y27_05055 [Clostridia bacterium]